MDFREQLIQRYKLDCNLPKQLQHRLASQGRPLTRSAGTHRSDTRDSLQSQGVDDISFQNAKKQFQELISPDRNQSQLAHSFDSGSEVNKRFASNANSPEKPYNRTHKRMSLDAGIMNSARQTFTLPDIFSNGISPTPNLFEENDDRHMILQALHDSRIAPATKERIAAAILVGNGEITEKVVSQEPSPSKQKVYRRISVADKLLSYTANGPHHIFPTSGGNSIHEHGPSSSSKTSHSAKSKSQVPPLSSGNIGNSLFESSSQPPIQQASYEPSMTDSYLSSQGLETGARSTTSHLHRRSSKPKLLDNISYTAHAAIEKRFSCNVQSTITDLSIHSKSVEIPAQLPSANKKGNIGDRKRIYTWNNKIYTELDRPMLPEHFKSPEKMKFQEKLLKLQKNALFGHGRIIRGNDGEVIGLVPIEKGDSDSIVDSIASDSQFEENIDNDRDTSVFASILKAKSNSIKLSGQNLLLTPRESTSMARDRMENINKQKSDLERLKQENIDLVRKKKEDLMYRVEIRKRIQEFRKKLLNRLREKNDPHLGSWMRRLDDDTIMTFIDSYKGYKMSIDAILSAIQRNYTPSQFLEQQAASHLACMTKDISAADLIPVAARPVSNAATTSTSLSINFMSKSSSASRLNTSSMNHNIESIAVSDDLDIIDINHLSSMIYAQTNALQQIYNSSMDNSMRNQDRPPLSRPSINPPGSRLYKEKATEDLKIVGALAASGRLQMTDEMSHGEVRDMTASAVQEVEMSDIIAGSESQTASTFNANQGDLNVTSDILRHISDELQTSMTSSNHPYDPSEDFVSNKALLDEIIKMNTIDTNSIAMIDSKSEPKINDSHHPFTPSRKQTIQPQFLRENSFDMMVPGSSSRFSRQVSVSGNVDQESIDTSLDSSQAMNLNPLIGISSRQGKESSSMNGDDSEVLQHPRIIPQYGSKESLHSHSANEVVVVTYGDTFYGSPITYAMAENRKSKVKAGIPYQKYVRSLSREKNNLSREETLRKITGASRLQKALHEPFPDHDKHAPKIKRLMRDPAKPKPFVAI